MPLISKQHRRQICIFCPDMDCRFVRYNFDGDGFHQYTLSNKLRFLLSQLEYIMNNSINESDEDTASLPQRINQQKRFSLFKSFGWFGITWNNKNRKLKKSVQQNKETVTAIHQPPLVMVITTSEQLNQETTTAVHRPPLVMAIPTSEHLYQGLVQCILRRHGTHFTLAFQSPNNKGRDEVPALMAQQQEKHSSYIFDATGCNHFHKQTIQTTDFRCIGKLSQQETALCQRGRNNACDDDANSCFALYNYHGFHSTHHQIASISIYAPSDRIPRKSSMVIRQKWNDDVSVVLNTKGPYTKGHKKFGLHFEHCRGKVASNKNCILQDCHQRMVLQLIKVGPHTFHLDYKAPLTAFQAFGFALAQWGTISDSQIECF